jgi:hypothetical protein
MSRQAEVSNRGRPLGRGAIASLAGVGILLASVFQNTESVRFQSFFLKFAGPLG